MPVLFRPLAPADIEDVVAMMAQLYARDSNPFDAARARRTTAALLAEPESGAAWMMEADGAPAGYLVLTLGYSLEFGGRFGLLDELFVAEEHRGKGIGRQALEFASRESIERGWRALRLEVGQENRRAIALYERSGFEMHDRFLMTKWM